MAYGNITTEQIQTFLSVAKTLNMRKSAEDLSVTQSAVSKRISAFETSTGIILFTNHKNNLNITPAGKYLYTELKKEYSALINILNHAQTIQKSYSQVFNIGTSSTFDSGIMLQIVNKFIKVYPELEINVIIDNSDLLAERLFSEEMNVITQPVLNVIDYPEISYEVFTKMQFSLLASKDNKAIRSDGSIDIKMLLNDNLYIPSEALQNSRIHKNNLHAFAEKHKARITEVPNKESAFYQVMMNKGITVVFGTNVSPNFHTEKMRTIVVPLEEISYDYALCYKNAPNNKVKDFCRIFSETLSEKSNREIIDRDFGNSTHR